MPRLVKRLTARAVEQKRKPGYYADGGGLYLQISRSGSKSWVFRFMRHGRAREMGLGSLNHTSLHDARIKARQGRQLLEQDIDPIAARDDADAARRLQEAGQRTFNECAADYIEAHKAGWRNAKHAKQWQSTLATYGSPVIGQLPVHAIDTEHVMNVLGPIWNVKTETASRVRGRLESVLDWAAVRGLREGENPARWRGHLDKLLPKRSKVAQVRHHPALPYPEMGDFMRALRERDGIAPRALELLILTATRVSEVVHAQWDEIDVQNRTWTIPGVRMKSGREHRVPLSDAALRVVETMKARQSDDYLFPGWRIGRPLTTAACPKLLREMGHADCTVHGFRSTFRDWAAEQTNYPREVAEAALAHVIEDKTEAAYRRGDLFERRARLMEDWAAYCGQAHTAAGHPDSGNEDSTMSTPDGSEYRRLTTAEFDAMVIAEARGGDRESALSMLNGFIEPARGPGRPSVMVIRYIAECLADWRDSGFKAAKARAAFNLKQPKHRPSNKAAEDKYIER